MRRRMLVLCAVPLIIFASASGNGASAESTPGEQFVPPGPPTATSVGITFQGGVGSMLPSYLAADSTAEGHQDAQGYSVVQQSLCTGYDDANCKSGATIYYLARLPVCADALDLDCINGLFAIKSDGTKVNATYVRNMPGKISYPYQGNFDLGLPRPGTSGIWTIPGVTHGGGSDTYAVVVSLFSSASKVPGVSLTEPFIFGSFSAQIFPVNVVKGDYKATSISTGSSPNGTMRLRWNLPGATDSRVCAIVADGECALRETFPMETAFGLSIRLSHGARGWFHGRISDPQIDYQSSPSQTSITIQAFPVGVPIVSAWTERANLPSVVPGGGAVPMPGTSMVGSAAGDYMMNLLRMWLPIVKDRAQASATEWNFGTLDSSEMEGADRCILDSKTLAGFVSTNSTTYSSGPPRYNAATGSLDYSLVSPHFSSSGEIFKGVYTLKIRSDVARCIYNFSTSPIRATVSVISESGISSIATESVNERDGWIQLTASGFEFSNPTVRVKFWQDPEVAKVAVPVKIVRVVPKTPVARSRTITCVKGKKLRIIAAGSPKCPQGFRKR